MELHKLIPAVSLDTSVERNPPKPRSAERRRMKVFCSVLCVLALVLGVVPTGNASGGAGSGFAGNTFRLDFTGQDGQRYLGSVPAGDVASVGFTLYVDDPARRAKVLGLEVTQYENTLRPGLGLVLPKQTFALGLNVPTARQCGIRTAVTQQTFANDDPFSSFGVYPYYGWSRGNIEAGMERDERNANFAYVAGKLRSSVGTLFYGTSTEYYEERRAAIEKHQYERTGLAYLADVAPLQLQGFAGANVNWDTGKPTWTAGLSRYASLNAMGANPAVHVSLRHKPGTDYALAMVTLYGRAINSYATSAIDEAFFLGGLKTSRIIGGRNFDTPGIGSSYPMQDFGNISIAASLLSVEAGTTARLISRDVSGYATLPGTIGPFTNPFIGVTWNEFSDLVYDPVLHQLNDPMQQYWVFKLGGKLRLSDRQDPKNQRGYVRLGVEVTTRGSVLAKSTVWF